MISALVVSPLAFFALCSTGPSNFSVSISLDPSARSKTLSAVADLLSVNWYSEQWPLISKKELEISAIDFGRIAHEFRIAGHPVVNLQALG